MAFLKSGDPIVVDSHVLANAAKQERDGVAGAELAIINELVRRCPRICLSPKQVAQDGAKGELVSALRQRGFRFPMQSTLIDRLDADGKVDRLARSAVAPLSNAASAALRGGGHGNLSDDEHLFEVAIAKRTVIVTQDESMLARAGDLARHTGVEVLHPGSVLERLTEDR